MEATIPNLNRTISKTTNPVTGVESFTAQQYTNFIGSLSISQRIGFTGGSLSLNTGLERIENYFKDSTATSYYSTPINIRLDQPIFQYNAFKWERKIQPLVYDIAKRRYLEDIEQVNLTLTNYFFNLLQAQIEKKISEVYLANYDTLYKIAEGRFQLGKIAQNELLTLKLRVLNGRAAVENAGLNLDQSLYRFRSFLRINDTIPLVLIPPAGLTYFIVDPNRAVGLADANSSRSLDFKRRELEAASMVNKAKMDGRFDANLTAIFGYNQSALTVPEAYKSPLDQEIVSLGVRLPILDWGVARGHIKESESNEEIEKNKVAQERIDFKRQVYLLGVQFNMQKNQVMIASLADTVARQTYDVTKGRYLIGKNITITELNTAQTETDAAQRDYYSALKTYWSTYFDLRKLTLYDFINNEPLRFNWDEVKP
jgi:outer membrane protein TolC